MPSRRRAFDEVSGVIGRLFVLFGAACLIAFAAIFALQAQLESLTPVEEQSLFAAILVVGLLVGHVVVTLVLERADWTIGGLGERAFRPAVVLESLLIACLAIGVPAGILLLSGHSSLGPGSTLGTWGGFAIEAGIVLALSATAEELIFRGFLAGVLADRWGELVSLFWTSVLFGALSSLGQPGPLLATISGYGAGLLLGAIRLRTGSLPAAIAAHSALNWAQAALLHAPLRGAPLAAPPGYAWRSEGPGWFTGGTAGLEGSALTAACLLVVTFLVLRTTRPATRLTRA